jgi:hypothetical protein
MRRPAIHATIVRVATLSPNRKLLGTIAHRSLRLMVIVSRTGHGRVTRGRELPID